MAWGEFSRKACESIKYSDARLNIWEGAVRSSKTISSIARWMMYIKNAPPGDLAMLGKTERTLKRNILDPMAQILGSNRFSLNQGEGIVTIGGRRIYLYGANNIASENKIRGVTLAGAYGDELTLWPESMFKMLLTRLSVPGSQFFGTTNPDNPYHWLRTDYLQKLGPEDLKQFHFTLEDNVNLDPVYVAALKKEFSGLWYKRFIDGLWVMAEGIIYDSWNDEIHLIDDAPVCDKYYLGIDYGTASSAMVFLLLGYNKQLNKIYVIDEYYYSGKEKQRQKTDNQYLEDLKAFLRNAEAAMSGKRISKIIPDPSAASFITLLKQKGFPVKKANNEVMDGIRHVSSLLADARILVCKRCKNFRKEISSYVWDEKAAAKGEDAPIKLNDHCMDALRYIIHTMFTDRGARAFGLKPEGF